MQLPVTFASSSIICCMRKIVFFSCVCFCRDKTGQFQSFWNHLCNCTSLQVFPASDVMKILTLVFVSSAPTTPEYKTQRNKIPYLHYFGNSSQLSNQNLITSQHESIRVVHLRAEGGIRFCFCFSPSANETESRCAGVIHLSLFPESQLGNARLGTINKSCVSTAGAEGHCGR